MASGETSEKRRPDTCMTPPPVNSTDIEVLEHLLRVELDRLETAQKIEKDRETVFPETSVIVRDCIKLHDRLQELRRASMPTAGADDNTDEFLARLAAGDV